MKKEHNNKSINFVDSGFNPCSNGMKKELFMEECENQIVFRFNPCSNGMKKEQKKTYGFYRVKQVLILVLMEWRKNLYKGKELWWRRSFNPCSNGMKKEHNTISFGHHLGVLILVLMEWRKNKSIVSIYHK